jgi:hypothetical protein
MRFVKLTKGKMLLGAAVLALAVPVIGQDSPESLLPPGFGDPVEETKPAPSPPRSSDGPSSPRLDTVDPSSLDREQTSSRSGSSGDASGTSDAVDGEDKEGEEESDDAAFVLPDLPAQARRSTAQVGVLAADDGDMGAAAFGASNGPYLSYLLKSVQAPIASRWASISLRRALLSRVDTPAATSGSTFAADRAWLLLRMGEADAARMLIQAVDPDQYDDWSKTIAMQAGLATADPAAICPAAEGHPLAGKDGQWMLSRAICSAFSGETSLAGALVDQAQDSGRARGIDALLAEKVVGAASNARRSVKIEWENVDRLTAWRFGLATATALKIPDPLLATAGPQLRAWRARAPLLPVQDRTADVEYATAMGVFSSAALVDHYGQLAELAEQSGNAAPPQVEAVSNAFGAANDAERANAISALWSTPDQNEQLAYARLVAMARAAAMVAPAASVDLDPLVAAMLSAGLDVQAARWQKQADEGGLAWGILAVGSPAKPGSISASSVSGFDAGRTEKRAQFLLAGLAGLGRLSPDLASSLAEDMDVPLGRVTRWTKAIDRAAKARQPGTVAVLAALGLQSDDWNGVSAANLYHVIAAYRAVGMEAEARMIAAEAVTRG